MILKPGFFIYLYLFYALFLSFSSSGKSTGVPKINEALHWGFLAPSSWFPSKLRSHLPAPWIVSSLPPQLIFAVSLLYPEFSLIISSAPCSIGILLCSLNCFLCSLLLTLLPPCSWLPAILHPILSAP